MVMIMISFFFFFSLALSFIYLFIFCKTYDLRGEMLSRGAVGCKDAITGENAANGL